MKKLLFSLLLCITAISSFAQTEVKGLETKRVIYDGPSYTKPWSIGGGDGRTYTKYYGWKITNHNSIKVSVEIELWSQGNNNHIVKTQSIILKSGESYIFKREEHSSTRVDGNDSDCPISAYYIKCRAYKLE